MIIVTTEGNEVATGVVANGGTFAIEVALAEGTHTLTAVQKDAAGNLSLGSANFGITVDTTAPTKPTFSPVHNATGVPVGADLVLTFGEEITKGTGLIELRSSNGGTLIEQFDVADSGRLSFGKTTLTINPTANLSYSTGYYVTVVSGAVLDLAGNPYEGFTTTTAFNFTTQAAPPSPPPPPPPGWGDIWV
jgi:hypothetical protein